MREHNIAKYTLVSVIVLGVVVIAVFSIRMVMARSWGSKPQNTNAADRRAEARAMVDALRRGGIREAAKLKGHYAGTYDPYGDWMDYDTELLTKHSTAVIVGIPKRNLGGRLSASGDVITTQYQVDVQEVIKGSILQGSTTKVNLPGGRVQFKDGTSAELRAINFEGVEEGRTYTFFLTEYPDGKGVFALTAGPRGVLETPAGGNVKSLAQPTDAIAKETKDKGTESFLNEVRLLVLKWPLPLKCCSE